MLSDPQPITYATAAISLPRVGTTDTQSEYKIDVSGVTYDLLVIHAFKARNRVVARLQRASTVSDPLVPAQNIPASMTATLTLDFPTAGLTASDASNLGEALLSWASTSGLLVRLCNGET